MDTEHQIMKISVSVYQKAVLLTETFIGVSPSCRFKDSIYAADFAANIFCLYLQTKKPKTVIGRF